MEYQNCWTIRVQVNGETRVRTQCVAAPNAKRAEFVARKLAAQSAAVPVGHVVVVK